VSSIACVLLHALGREEKGTGTAPRTSLSSPAVVAQVVAVEPLVGFVLVGTAVVGPCLDRAAVLIA
jgi:hypothetical protein